MKAIEAVVLIILMCALLAAVAPAVLSAYTYLYTGHSPFSLWQCLLGVGIAVMLVFAVGAIAEGLDL